MVFPVALPRFCSRIASLIGDSAHFEGQKTLRPAFWKYISRFIDQWRQTHCPPWARAQRLVIEPSCCGLLSLGRNKPSSRFP
jgi:hypothetical protein